MLSDTFKLAFIYDYASNLEGSNQETFEIVKSTKLGDAR